MTENVGLLVNDRYRIEEAIGSGGMAEVFKAFDLVEKNYVAIKVIKQEYCVDPQYMRRFEREAQTVLNLKHRNIVGAYEYGTYMGRGYIVLEYVEGCTLKEYILKNGALDPKSAVRLITKVLDALEYAHAQGYIHRDVKPQNVLLTDDKTVKLADFGIAKGTDSQTHTYDGNHVIGSVHYISPEQAKGEEVGKESDLYSVGIMFYEMLVGRPPFEGDNSVQIAIKHINDTVTLPEEMNSKIPPALKDVLMKATAKDSEKRYHSAFDMKHDLIRALTHPKKRFVPIEDEPAGSDTAREGRDNQKVKLWHIILPVALMLFLVASIFAVWYINMISTVSSNPRIPNLLGKNIEAAAELAKNRDYELSVAGELPSDEYPEGTICRQTPEAGTAKKAGSIIEVFISSGSEAVSMPDLTGKTLDEALTALSQMGIGIASVNYALSDAPAGAIIWQSIPANNEVMRGDTVDVQVSGAENTLFPMPNLTEKNIYYGISLLKLYGINDYTIKIAAENELNPDKTYSSGTVISQTPSALIPITPFSTHIEMIIYLDKETAAKADFVCEITVPEDNSTVTAALHSELGEVIIYEEQRDKGAQKIKFDAFYMKNGKYICVVCVNHKEALRIEKTFSGAKTEAAQKMQDITNDSRQ